MPDSFSVIRNTATAGVGVEAKRKCYVTVHTSRRHKETNDVDFMYILRSVTAGSAEPDGRGAFLSGRT